MTLGWQQAPVSAGAENQEAHHINLTLPLSGTLMQESDLYSLACLDE